MHKNTINLTTAQKKTILSAEYCEANATDDNSNRIFDVNEINNDV